MNQHNKSKERAFYEGLPKKRVGAGVLLFNQAGELLIVKPAYKTYWSIPGGVVEADESPRAGALRETREEIGISLKKVTFLCTDYYRNEYNLEGLLFLFAGGLLSAKQIAAIKLAQGELTEYRFVSIKKALSLLGRNLARRLPVCLEALVEKRSVYLEEGR